MKYFPGKRGWNCSEFNENNSQNFFFFFFPPPFSHWKKWYNYLSEKAVVPARSQAPSSSILPVIRVQIHGIVVPLCLEQLCIFLIQNAELFISVNYHIFFPPGLSKFTSPDLEKENCRCQSETLHLGSGSN